MRNESDIIRILDSEEKNKVDKIFNNFLEESDLKKINTFLQSKKVEERRKIFNEYNENTDYKYCLDTLL